MLQGVHESICALAGHGVGVPQGCCLDVKSFCEKYLCQLFNSGFTSPKALRWHMKGHQGVLSIYWISSGWIKGTSCAV